MKLSERIRQLRKENGITQSQLGEAICLSQQSIAAWETERATPDAFTVVRLAKYFSVSADYLLGLSDTKTPYETRDDIGIELDSHKLPEVSDEQLKKVLPGEMYDAVKALIDIELAKREK